MALGFGSLDDRLQAATETWTHAGQGASYNSYLSKDRKRGIGQPQVTEESPQWERSSDSVEDETPWDARPRQACSGSWCHWPKAKMTRHSLGP